MKLAIISLQGIQFDDDIISVNLKTTSGEITVLEHHRPLISSLEKGKVVVAKKDGEKINFDIESGFLDIGADNKATILAG